MWSGHTEPVQIPQGSKLKTHLVENDFVLACTRHFSKLEEITALCAALLTQEVHDERGDFIRLAALCLDCSVKDFQVSEKSWACLEEMSKRATRRGSLDKRSFDFVVTYGS